MRKQSIEAQGTGNEKGDEKLYFLKNGKKEAEGYKDIITVQSKKRPAEKKRATSDRKD
jgi:hypothetical protein